MWLLFAFIGIPLIEIALFIQLGDRIGTWPTLAIVVLTAVLGTYLVRAQGALAMNQLRSSFEELRDPTEPLAHGAMILIAGALLITPGFFTDTVGFLLLFPPFRAAAFRYLRERVEVRRFEMGNRPDHPSQPDDPGTSRDDVIDVDYEDITPPRDRRQGGSGWTRH